jgi:hypothetical protein
LRRKSNFGLLQLFASYQPYPLSDCAEVHSTSSLSVFPHLNASRGMVNTLFHVPLSLNEYIVLSLEYNYIPEADLISNHIYGGLDSAPRLKTPQRLRVMAFPRFPMGSLEKCPKRVERACRPTMLDRRFKSGVWPGTLLKMTSTRWF